MNWKNESVFSLISQMNVQPFHLFFNFIFGEQKRLLLNNFNYLKIIQNSKNIFWPKIFFWQHCTSTTTVRGIDELWMNSTNSFSDTSIWQVGWSRIHPLVRPTSSFCRPLRRVTTVVGETNPSSSALCTKPTKGSWQDFLQLITKVFLFYHFLRFAIYMNEMHWDHSSTSWLLSQLQ